MLAISVLGFFNVSYFSICYSHAIKLTPRIGEAASIGMINLTANVCGFIQLCIWSFINFKEDDKSNVLMQLLYSIMAGLVIAILLFCFIKEHRPIMN